MDPTDLDEAPEARRKSYRFEAPTSLHFVPPPEPEAPKYASVRDRAKALAFDALVWVAGVVPLGVLFGGISSSNGPLRIKIGGPPMILATVLWLVYMTVMEARHGASLGKRRNGLRVLMEDGGAVSAEAALLRNVLRFLDAAPYVVPYLVGIRAIRASRTMQRFGDRVAETIVVYSPDADAEERSDVQVPIVAPLEWDAEPAPAPKRKRRLLKVMIVVLLVLAAGGAAAAFFLMRGPS